MILRKKIAQIRPDLKRKKIPGLTVRPEAEMKAIINILKEETAEADSTRISGNMADRKNHTAPRKRGAVKVTGTLHRMTGATATVHRITGAIAMVHRTTGATVTVHRITGAIAMVHRTTGATATVRKTTAATDTVHRITAATDTVHRTTAATVMISHTSLFSGRKAMRIAPGKSSGY
jgi:hypothetical protein